MTDDQHGEGTPQGGGRWDPLPQGDYDDGATAFVKLPEGGIDALLAAPGHGYVPPPIAAGPAPDGDPSGTGSWAVPAEGVQWPDPNAVPQQGTAGGEQFAYHPGATGQWTFQDTNAPAPGTAPGHDVTGEWSIPVAGGDLPDESGEFTTSALVEQWGGTPPATLPGGAPAPWATDGAGQNWAQQASGTGVTERPGQSDAHTDGRGAAYPASGTDGRGTAYSTSGTDGRGTAYPATDTDGRGVAHPADRSGEHPAAEATHRPYEEPQGADPYAHARTEAVGDPYGDARGDRHDDTGAELAAPDAQSTDADGTTDGAAGGDAEGAEGATERPAEPSAAADASDGAEAAPEAAEAPVTAPDTDAPDEDAEPAPKIPGEEHPLASYVLRVNGADRPVTDAWIGESLLYVLRERLGLAGAKDGCSQGECGACNVQVDGRLVASCLVPAVTAAGSEVRTVEGLAVEGQPSDVQRALAKCGAVQCGFCVPGMAMTVHDLLEGNPAPTELEARQALCGNLCRCSGYRGVLDAVQEVVAEREAHAAAAEPESDGDEARIPHQAGPGGGGVHQSAFESPRTQDQVYGQDGGQA
ncbi:2Fe-2S iron-sulfur cluster-binding protein [Streptomyces sp. MBT53]|uniref:2Fe-2S iron-sulfur cluster-binding protein n=1 Tax=Streptomyces sp. MBT53 TaxID=1488384 RepID=UPI00191453CA|nr:2Fe-2S iron-sulfur cluster-binding protein [Streptomyces sp. MBT53]MBK6014140.1 (2Fe-2S)-binding protein [Streptomyces sp. MBT53]